MKKLLHFFAEVGDSIDFKVGTMIEIPRAALTADRIASSAEFFSFGTNDLTQMTFGIHVTILLPSSRFIWKRKS